MTQLSIDKHRLVAELRHKVEAQSKLIRFYQTLPVDWAAAPPGSRRKVTNLTTRITNPRKSYRPWLELKLTMRVRKLSVLELARQLGVTPQSVTRWLAGLSRPNPYREMDIARLTGVWWEGRSE
jgi:hypothetical protein